MDQEALQLLQLMDLVSETNSNDLPTTLRSLSIALGQFQSACTDDNTICDLRQICLLLRSFNVD